MSGSVDSRVTTMKFDNAQYERGAAQTLSTLDKLKRMLDFSDSHKSIAAVQSTLNGTNLAPLHAGIEGINKAWAAMATVAITALANITNRAVDAGIRMAKSFTVDPIKEGLREYETTLNSIQTILANTNGENVRDVNAALDELNEYSDKTIYNFGEMAKNIGTFTAAGVKLKPSVEAIKGISNLAALSGSNSQQASTAMYQLSQALAAGKVSLMDWNSVVNAGMGGKVFQKAIQQTAEAHGVAVDKIVKDAGSFRASISKGWITDDILTDTLRTFTGDLTKEQLKAMGYNDKLIAGIMKRAQTANEAATKVKTFTQLIQTLQESAGSGWADTWELIFGDIKEARELWTGVSEVLGGFIKDSAEARNKVLGDWKELGGRTVLIEAIKNAFTALMNIIKPIKEAFRDIFPAMTGQRLYDLTVALRDFTDGMTLSKPTMENLRRTFAGVFAVLDIGWTIVRNIVGGFLEMFGIVGSGTGSILGLTGSIGDVLVALRDWLEEGDKIGEFFDRIQESKQAVIQPLVTLITKLVDAVAALITGGFDAFVDSLAASFQAIGPVIEGIGKVIGDTFGNLGEMLGGVGSFSGVFEGFGSGADKVANGLDKVTSALTSTKDAGDGVKDSFNGVGEFFSGIGEVLAGVGTSIVNGFKAAKSAIGNFLQGLGIEDTLAVINTGFLIALYIAFRKFLKNVGGVFVEMKNTFRSASGVLDQVTANLKSMQTEVRARAILQIAAALALLAGALFILSKIDTAELGKSLAAVAILLTMLASAIVVLEKKTDSFGGAARVSILAAAMVLFGLAMLAMAGAVAVLAQLDTAELAKGVGAMAAIMAVMVGSAAILEKSGGAASMLVAAGAILVLAAALTALVGALKLYASIDKDTLINGGLKVAAIMVGLAVAMRLMPKNMLVTAAGLFIVANALVILAGALKIMGGLSVEEMAKSLIMLGGTMLILAVGLNAMAGTAGGAAAVLIFAGALAVLVPSLVILGNLDMSTILKALGALAGVFVILGAAGYILGPVVPVIISLAGAIALLGLGVALVGGGLFLFAAGLATLAASGAAGLAVLTAAIITVAELFPLIMHQFGLGIRAFAVVIAESGPQLVRALSTLLGSIIEAVIENTPKLARMLYIMIRTGLAVIRATFPDLVRTGMQIILNILTGIEQNIGKITRKAVNIAVNFLKALSDQLPKLVDAGIEFIISFINGLADGITKYTAEITAAGLNLATAVIEGIIKGLADAVQLGRVVDAAVNVAKKAFDAAKDFLGIKSPSKEFEKLGKFVNMGFANGMIGSLDKVDAAMSKWKDLIGSVIDETKSEIDDLKSQIKDLNEQPKKNAEEIDKLTKKLERAEGIYKRATDARKEYNKELKDERDQLRGLGKQYDEYTVKIDAAKQALEEAVRLRDDFNTSTTSKFKELPDITAETTPEEFAEGLRAQDVANEKFLESLNQLRDTMNLNDDVYRQLLDEGVGIQPFIDSLLAGGPDAIAHINRLTDELGASAAAIGSKASSELYQAGVDSAQGFLDGLIAERDAIEKEMSGLAKAIVKAIKKALKIKSPSKVMEELGKFTNQGFAKGLDKHASLVEKSAANVANSALEGIKSTLENVSASVMTDVNTNPVITPVLDLTQVTKDAATMNGIMDKAMVAKASYGQALSISDEQAARIAEQLNAPDTPTVSLKYEQTIQSPKALSEVEIYRDTKNLLSTAKEALSRT